MSIAGSMVAKIPANRMATSWMGWYVNSFSFRTPAGVLHTETAAAAAITISRQGVGKEDGGDHRPQERQS